MIAALIVALLNAASMVVGFAFYMNGMMGSAVNEISSDASGSISMGDAMKTLGLTLRAVRWRFLQFSCSLPLP